LTDVYTIWYHRNNQIISVRESKSGFIVQCFAFEYFIKVISLTEMQKGTIARLTDRGFGFITRAGEEKDLFFHSNELKDVQFNELSEGDELTFEVAEGPKGLNAVNITRA